MKLSIRRAVVFASLAGTLALAPAGVALADAGNDAAHAKHHGGHREGLIGASLRLESLTPDQRSSIEQLVAERRAASVPVRQADARVLTELAQQVEQAHVDPDALAQSLSAERSAAVARGTVDKDTLGRLHALLTPAQRGQLVDELTARRAPEGARTSRERFEHGGSRLGLTQEQEATIRANLGASREPAGDAREHARANHAALHAALESFRGETFDPSALVRIEVPGEHAERLARAMTPVLTPAQRASFAGELRNRATRAAS
jgi:Spy/CpxP family protein refolding chaperone